jgi:hypothetical protein
MTFPLASRVFGIAFTRMICPNEFWLQVHRLADAYDAEGLTRQERAENIVSQFLEMPRIAQRAILDDLRVLALCLPDIYPLAVAAANEQEEAGKQRRQGDVA